MKSEFRLRNFWVLFGGLTPDGWGSGKNIPDDLFDMGIINRDEMGF